MDGAKAGGQYLTIVVKTRYICVGGCGGCDKACGASLGVVAASADLGGSSEYSIENFEDRSGEGFHVNTAWTWVSRP